MPIGDTVVEDVWSDVETVDAYAALGLSRNPFPASGTSPASPSIPPYPDVYQQVTDFLKSFLRSRQSRGLALLGDYGTGKTYHLLWIRSLLLARPEVSIRVVYAETPGLEPYDLVREILAQIGDQDLARAVWALVVPIIRSHVREQGQKFFQRFAEGTVKGRKGLTLSLESAGMELPFMELGEDTLRDHRRFLAAFDRSAILSREKLRDWVAEQLYQSTTDETSIITKNPAIARELANLCALSGAPALKSWERLTVPGSSTAFPSRGEPEFLRTILRLLLNTGTEYFVLLLDEFEKIPLMENMTSREMKRYLDTVRMLADRAWREEELPFAWVIASQDEAWSLVENELNRALSERFLTEIHLPRSNDPDVARYLVSRSLALVRLDGEAEESLRPLPDRLIELIPPELRRTPRDLLTLCYGLVEEAVNRNVQLESGKIPEIFVSEFLARNYLVKAGNSGTNH